MERKPIKVSPPVEQHNQYGFFNLNALIQWFIYTEYRDKHIIVIFNAKKALDEDPRLRLLKRDNLGAFLEGIKSDFMIIECDTEREVIEKSYELPTNVIINEVYSKGRVLFSNVPKNREMYDYMYDHQNAEKGDIY